METPSTSSADEAQALRASLQAMVKEGRFGQALTLCDRLRRERPADPALATMQAYSHFRLGQHASAVAAAAEAVGLDASNPTAAFVLGVSNRELGHHAEAARALLIAYEKLPDRADIACLLLEETVAADGVEAGRPLLQRIAGRIADRKVAACWAKLLFRAGAETELPPGYVAAPLMSVPDWAAKAGVAMDWVGEPEAMPWLDPIIAGEPEAPRNRSSYLGYTPYVCTIRDATIFSKSNMVLTPDGAALHDTTADKDYGRFITNFMSELSVAERIGDRLLLDVGQYQPGGDVDAAMFLSGSVSEHFGHWVSEYLPRLNLLRRHPRFESLPIIVDSVMPPQHFEYLRLVVSNPIIQLQPGSARRCRELIVAAPATFYPVHLDAGHGVPPERQGALSVDGLRFIFERVLARLPPPRRTDRKIYLSRRKRGGRRPRNEDEICAYLAARGFEIVHPEDLSFVEQAQIFQEANVVVLSTGSAVMNCIFSAQGTEFFVLSQRGLFNWGVGCGWMDALGYGVTFICDRQETARKHDNYMVSIPDLEAGLSLAANLRFNPT